LGSRSATWEAGTYFATGEVGRPLGSAHQTQAPYQAVRSSDGYVTVGAITPKTWEGLCRALGLEELLDEERYAESSRRRTHREELITVIEKQTIGRTTHDLVTALDAAGVPCAPIEDYGQVFTDEHLREREFFWDAPHPDMGAVRQIGSPMRFSRTPTRREEAGPVLGADTREALLDAGYTAADVDSLVASGAAREAET
jgi:formyl-CoA transferase